MGLRGWSSPAANASHASTLTHGPGGTGTTAVSQAIAGLNGWTLTLTILLVLVAYDQFSYIWKKGSLPGPTFKIPFIGPFLDSVNPTFAMYEAKWASGELSCVSVFHKFVVIAATRDMARRVFTSPTYVKPYLVDIAQTLLRPTNWVFLDGKAHTDYRKGLNSLFARKSLELYLPGQEEVYDKYFQTFIDMSRENEGRPIPFMTKFREFNCAVSCRVFVGHYISDEAVKRIARDYYWITAAMELVNFPIYLPYTKPWYGIKASRMVVNEFAKCAAKSKVRMQAGGEVTCIVDSWINSMFESEEYRRRSEAGESAETLPEKPAVLLRVFTDSEIALTLMSFLFASQDASSSATTWLFQTMANRPDVLDRVREENLQVRDGDKNRPLTMDMLESMTYTRAVVKEILRYRPPVSMVPYEAKRAFPITDTYSVPKGAIIIPTLHPALQDPEAYPNPETYDPERWISGDAEKMTKNWLVFGTGPHYCLGQVYAQQNLMAMIGKASLQLDWKHHATPKSEAIKVFACIWPQDDCPLVFTRRP